jgi:hypothetical protein
LVERVDEWEGAQGATCDFRVTGGANMLWRDRFCCVGVEKSCKAFLAEEFLTGASNKLCKPLELGCEDFGIGVATIGALLEGGASNILCKPLVLDCNDFADTGVLLIGATNKQFKLLVLDCNDNDDVVDMGANKDCRGGVLVGFGNVVISTAGCNFQQSFNARRLSIRGLPMTLSVCK